MSTSAEIVRVGAAGSISGRRVTEGLRRGARSARVRPGGRLTVDAAKGICAAGEGYLNAMTMTRVELEAGLRAWGFGSAEAARIARDLRSWGEREAMKDRQWQSMSEEQRARRRALGIDRDHACGGPS